MTDKNFIAMIHDVLRMHETIMQGHAEVRGRGVLDQEDMERLEASTERHTAQTIIAYAFDLLAERAGFDLEARLKADEDADEGDRPDA
jgi:hypothetical protein